MAKLGDYIEQIRGVSYKPDDICNPSDLDAVAILRANNIQDDGLNFDDLVCVKKSKVSNKQYIQKGDIVVCASSGSKSLVGKAAIATENCSISFGAFCKVVRPKKLIPSYLGYFFQSPKYRSTISELSGGANINNIRNEHIDELDILIVSEEKQESIANKLDALSNLISLRKQQLSKLDKLVKARFVEMFGDPVANEKGWRVEALNDVCNGIGDGLHGTPEYDDEGKYPFINGNNLTNGAIEITPSTKMVNTETYAKHYIEISENAVLLSINGTLGKLAFYNGEEVMLGKSACYCNLKPEINREFVYGVMRTDSFAGFLENNATASTIKNVGLKAIRGFRLIMPPEDLQMQFVEFSKQTYKLKFEVQQSLEKLETLKKSLMQQYFG